MHLVLELTKGRWFRKIVHKETDEINQPHVRKHIEVLDPGFFTTVRIKGHHIKIGRATSNHIILDAFRVSRCHCELIKHTPGHWHIKDLNSTYETHIRRGGTVIKADKKGVKIEQDDELEIGGNIILVMFFKKVFQFNTGETPE